METERTVDVFASVFLASILEPDRCARIDLGSHQICDFGESDVTGAADPRMITELLPCLILGPTKNRQGSCDLRSSWRW